MAELTPLRTTPGALTTPGGAPLLAMALMVNDSDSEVQILSSTGITTLDVARIDQNELSGRLVLVTNTVKYNWRPLREADGIWATEYQTPLPVEAIITLSSGDLMDESMLSAFTSGDSPYVLGVVFETADGRWVRTGGSFIPMMSDDDTYADMDRIIISPEKANEFLDLYDKNYVTVTDAASFETL